MTDLLSDAVFAVVLFAEVTSFSENVTADYGDNVTLFCTVVALGSNVSVIWSTSDTIFLPSSMTTPTGKNEYNGTLTFTNVTPESAGNYTCSVDSNFGDDMEDIEFSVIGL